jgi:phenylpyruvate tautomerase PptA (4-oxalocrotonate tautomerase family)
VFLNRVSLLYAFLVPVFKTINLGVTNMPYLKLTTNVTISETQTPELLKQFSQLMAQKTGKPEHYVMIEIAAGKPMLFSGTDEPLAYIECKSIGLAVAQTKPLAAAICQLLQTTLQINSERVYIEFSDCKADYWGWNGSTFG